MKAEQRITSRAIEFRDAGSDSPATISGYAAVFYRENDPGTQYRLWERAYERILPGAFDQALEEDDVRALFNHEPNLLLGRSSSGTLKLSVDEVGLRYEITPPDTAVYRDLRELLKRGDVSGSSFSFRVAPGGEEWRLVGDTEVRELKAVRLGDVGPVTFPAYEATTAEARSARDAWATRSRELSQAEQDRAELDRFLLRSLGG